MGDAAPKKEKGEAVGIEETGGGERDDLSLLSLAELETLLNEVLENEDYIRAISIRDEINKRK